MSSPHFEFVPGDEKIVAPGIVAKRIRALVAIPALLRAASVQPGDLGGYIAVSKNLGQYRLFCRLIAFNFDVQS